MEQRIGEVYLNDFSSGLITKKAYGRTDLDIFSKGLINIKNAIPNNFGNIENLKVDFITNSNITVSQDVLDNINNGNYIIVYRNKESDLGGIDILLYTFSTLGRLVEINKSTGITTQYNYIINGFYGGSSVGTNFTKIFCYDYSSDRIFFMDGFSISCVKIADLFKNKNSAYTVSTFFSNFLEFNPANSELKKMTELKTTGNSIATVEFKYDIRENYAEIVFKDFSGDVTTLDLTKEVEIEIYFGKFQRGGSSSGNVWRIIKSPIKDTTKVDSNGNITVETKVIQATNVFYRELYKREYMMYKPDDVFVYNNRLFIIKGTKMFASQLNKLNDFSNVENRDSESVVVDLPFEIFINKSLFNDLILFSNRGVFSFSGFISPQNSNTKFISSIVSDKKIQPLIIYNGVVFCDKEKSSVGMLVYNGETEMYDYINLTSIIDIKNIESIDYIPSNEKTSESLIVNNNENTFLFNSNNSEGVKFWTKLDKLNFTYTFYDETGNVFYVECTNSGGYKLVKKSLEFSNQFFEFELFKPDLYKGEKTPLFFNRNLIVKGIEIMYTGNGKIFVDNGSEGAKTVVDKRIFFNDTSFYQPFDEDVKIAKAENLHFQWGNKLSFGVQTEEEFRIYAIKLIFVL